MNGRFMLCATLCDFVNAAIMNTAIQGFAAKDAGVARLERKCTGFMIVICWIGNTHVYSPTRQKRQSLRQIHTMKDKSYSQ